MEHLIAVGLVLAMATLAFGVVVPPAQRRHRDDPPRPSGRRSGREPRAQ